MLASNNIRLFMCFKLVIIRAVVSIAALMIPEINALGGRVNQPFYEDPFDVAAGGSTLTRATQEGILINNPALLPYGGKFFRWFGMKTNILTGKDSVDVAREQLGGGGANNDDPNQFVDALFTKPIHFGLSQSLSLITNNGGFVVFGNFEPDLRAYRYGDVEEGAGVPNVVIRNELYAGAYFSLAARSNFEWLSFGLSFKYLLVNEIVTRINLVDQEAINQTAGQLSELQNGAFNNGIGLDVASLMFFQGKHMDLRFALTVADLKDTKLAGAGQPNLLRQTINGGLGLTFHTTADAIHLSADLRDISNVNEQELFKRLSVGARILLRTYLGLAVGLYHGMPTYGLEVDLLLLRVAATSYTREYGDRPGVDSRQIYQISFSLGFTF